MQQKAKLNIIQILRQPYGLETAVSNRWRMCVIFGLFVFLFLYIFQPFGLNGYPQGVLQLCLGYGLTTFVVMAILNIAIFSLFPGFFNEENWTVGRELTWTIINISVIGLANVIFTSFAGFFEFSLSSVLWYEFYTLVVGIFPAGINVLVKEARLKRRYETKSGEINTGIEEHKKELPIITREAVITILSDTANEELVLKLDTLYYIRSSDNYIEVYYAKGKDPMKKLLRNSLKRLEEITGEYPQLFRCHKSYMVNLDKVNHVSGNAQGYKLHLEGMDAIVPVSRQYNEAIRERLATAP